MLRHRARNWTGRSLGHRALAVLLLVLLVIMSWAVASMPFGDTGLAELVDGELSQSGVSNPVTAVLLNFRAYDTLLEVGVLLLALLGVWSLGAAPRDFTVASPPSAVLLSLTRLLVPLLMVVAGYLLWVGAFAPGGAFQAGALLAAAGVLLQLAGWHPGQRVAERFWRFGLAIGLALFISVGAAMVFFEASFLQYPMAAAGTLILLIETAATLSIGLTLTALFLGGHLHRAPVRLGAARDTGRARTGRLELWK